MISRKAAIRFGIVAAAIIAGAILLFGVARMLGFSWDPLGTQRARADAYVSTDLARDLEAEGYADQAQRLDTFHHQIVTVRTATEQAVTEARSAPDASQPIDPDRLARIRAHDERLCQTAPDLCPKPAGSD